MNDGITNFCPHVPPGEPPCAACRGDYGEWTVERLVSALERLRDAAPFDDGSFTLDDDGAYMAAEADMFEAENRYALIVGELARRGLDSTGQPFAS